MNELLAQHKHTEHSQFNYPLCVTLMGERAVDNGGPRREFLRLMMQAVVADDSSIFIKHEDGYVLSDDSICLRKQYYRGAEIVCGKHNIMSICFTSIFP